MCVKKGRISPFRKRYIQEILDIIKENAGQEFDIIWKENEAKNISRSILSDLISEKINDVADSIYASGLFKDKDLFEKVIKCCCPSVIMEQEGFENILARIPEPYLRAIFASRLSSRYVYKFGLDAGEIDFYNFLKEYK
jgi:glutamate dehydrogenase